MVTKSRTFTVFELFVAVAVVGVIALILFSILSDARGGGKQAAIESNLVSSRTQAEVYFYLNNLSHVGVCQSDMNADPPGIKDIVEALDEINGKGRVTCIDPPGSAREGWGVEVQLVKDPTKWYCIDSTGAAQIYNCSTLGGIRGDSDPQCGPANECVSISAPS